ncbi:conjugal transfer protein [uncultured Limosilactobacillus sp.]|uniref:conjugal transfer protein n=1 Tax=uncultured Limosilactobacillus sp. TaxID=2837629 RepID=UPI0025F0FDFB|nr:conjugal transfer protein [uncultured Limosilactobacillus sp.]
MRKRQVLRLQQAGYDLDFLARVQPQGNLKRHARYLQMGDGYVTCLRVYRYPAHGLGAFWGVPLTNNDSTMAVLSLGTEDRQAILKELSRSATEKKTQISGKQKEMDNVEAGNAYYDQMQLIAAMQQRNEIMKRFYCRIFVYAPTLDKLEKRCTEIIRNNGEFNMARYSDEQLDEFGSIFVPTMSEEDLLNKPIGTPISAYSLSGSYPFNHVKLDDPNGSYYGYTRTSGPIMFDPFLRDRRRTRSFFFVTGNAGMGKSTLLKKMNDDVFSRGAFIRNFDVSSEYTDQTKDQGGVTIRLDKPEFMINPFEVFATVVKDTDGSTDEIGSFAQHITKLKNFFKFLNEDVTSDDMELLGQWLNDFYITEGLWTKNPQQTMKDIKITGRPHDWYPTLQDFVTYANERKRKAERDPKIHITNATEHSMSRITRTFSGIEETKADMFEGITRFPDLSQEQVVTFNIQGLKAQGDGVFNAQIYSVFTLLSAEVIKNGLKLRRLLKEGRLDRNSIPWYYINLDEVENIVNPRFAFGVEFLASMMEQMRKNFCAITMAAPTIKDLIMNGNSHDPYILAVQKMFSLFQIRFFFQISDDDLPRLRLALGNSTTADELQSLPKLEKTECLMMIQGDRNIQFKVEITKEEERRYGGGI